MASREYHCGAAAQTGPGSRLADEGMQAHRDPAVGLLMMKACSRLADDEGMRVSLLHADQSPVERYDGHDEMLADEPPEIEHSEDGKNAGAGAPVIQAWHDAASMCVASI
eukprot:1160602-Pelagomonas_calceolata.AAC.17